MAKNTDYFNYFNRIAAIAVDEAVFLKSICDGYDSEKLEENMNKMHEMERAADDIRHELLDKLVKEFLPPFDHSDINDLVEKLDNMCDEFDDVVIKMYIYNVTSIREGVDSNLATLIECATKTQAMIKELSNFKKSSLFTEYFMAVGDLEEKGDSCYLEGTRKLYTTETDPIEVSKWTEIYREIEECYDACEEVAEAVRSIIVKNS